MFGVNIGFKILLLALLAFAAFNTDMPQFAGKAMPARAPFYGLFAFLIPLGWMLRGRPRPYPHDADALLVSPFLVDTLGNYLNLYNSQIWFDDVAHSVTWMLLVMSVGALMLRLGLAPWITASLCIGFGAVTHILWEIMEYVVMQTGTTGLQLTYGDTVGDLAMSLAGTVFAGLATGWRASARRSRAAREPAPRTARIVVPEPGA